MVNYAEGKIYKIYDAENQDQFYIGSTCDKLCRRITGHRNLSKMPMNKNVRLYQYVNNLEHKWENIKIELIEDVKCENIEQLRRAEGKYIREFKAPLNKRIEGRTTKEYNDDNREYINKRQREYYKEKSKKIDLFFN